MARKLFCEYGPLFYKLSVAKEIIRRGAADLRVKNFSRRKQTESLPCVVSTYTSPVIEELKGVDIQMQRNKENNMTLAGGKISGLLIRPGEVFSFWRIVGNCSQSKGYRTGLVLENGELVKGYGGGLCQLANHIHNLVLGSPLEVVELHHHSDALFPDYKPHIPYELGVSVLYNYIDYRFLNSSDQTVQLLIRLTPETMFGELRSEKPFPLRYELYEENHHFAWEGDACYRNSTIYRKAFDRETGEEAGTEFLHRLHSKVMYDPALIPAECVQNKTPV